MIFAHIVYSSILAGIASGLLSTCLQLTSLQPIITAAERLESRIEATTDHAAEHSDQDRDPSRVGVG